VPNPRKKKKTAFKNLPGGLMLSKQDG